MLPKLTNKLGRKLITVTLNPVLDRTLWVPNFTPGGTFLVDRSEDVAGGKGVNVSRALKHFGIDSVATGIMAEAGSEPYIRLLQKGGIAHDFVPAQGNLRINITVISDSKKGETHLRDRGPEVTESTLDALEEKLRNLKEKSSLFVLSGSIPHGLPDHTYYRLITTMSRWGCDVFFDASGGPLKKGITARPFFIKPNVHEVEEVLGFFPDSQEELVKAVNSFSGMGIKNVMISMGKKGLVFSRGKEIVHAQLPIDQPVNTVGSGDAALAGGLIGIVSKLNIEDTARIACAMGAANTLISGACIFNTEDVCRLFKTVHINHL
jgi:1-phosphofructokinase